MCDRPDYVSSQPRYDHFDISAYMLNSVLEYNAYLIFLSNGGIRYVPLRCPKFFARCTLRKISTAAVPYCSLYPPQAAVANVPLCGVRLCLRLMPLQSTTAAVPYCSLYPPQAAVANVPTSISLHYRYSIPHSCGNFKSDFTILCMFFVGGYYSFRPFVVNNTAHTPAITPARSTVPKSDAMEMISLL